ncbi:uncharacterized protein LOC128201214 [Galleria mellonella]|uniref:Uncharacterized protein LOC128201214 n=1 Tax=Galleria mellonella TaxID=7137 RepID=A0ABM3MPY5_GALME|nr:uncharacterized protein LOC128201214 [Galleria mellonella]
MDTNLRDQDLRIKQLIKENLQRKKCLPSRSRSRSPNIFGDSETQCPDDLPSVVATKKNNEDKVKENLLKEETNCSKCLIYGEEDKRNEYFGLLVAQEFKYIRPCVRTRCYEEILKYLREAKGQHVDQLQHENTEN